MKLIRYTVDENNKYTMHYGHGLANTLAYMLNGFRKDWEMFGLLKIDDDYNFGADVDGVPMCAVYGSRHQTTIQCDSDQSLEQEQIDAGKTAIVLFYGTDNSSFMRRMTPEEYDKMVLVTYKPETEDLYYNS